MTESHKPGVKRYRQPNGEPTCCRDMPAGKVCPHFAQINGDDDVCTALEMAPIARTQDFGGNWTIPIAGCPAWKVPA